MLFTPPPTIVSYLPVFVYVRESPALMIAIFDNIKAKLLG